MFLLEDNSNGAIFRSAERCLRIQFFTDSIARVTFTACRPFSDRLSCIIAGAPEKVTYEVLEQSETYILRTASLRIVLNKSTGALSYFTRQDKLLMREPDHGGKWLTPRPVNLNVFDRDSEIEQERSMDGARAIATNYKTVFARDAFEAKLEFVFAEDEALFGLGSHEEGDGNLRGHSRELYQQNLKAVVPHLVSTRGYSVLLDCCSAMAFHDDALGSYWWADCVDELDFYFIHGDNYHEILSGYQHLTGNTPLLPKWAFGYTQSKERYVTAAEMLEVVSEYRRRCIPLDVIVLDWKSWPNGTGWGQKSLDSLRFPDPDSFLQRIHAMGARLMVSIWPIMTGGCSDQRELLNHGWMLGNKSTYNAFLPEARKCYWEQAARGLFSHGVDAWWCDCTEPFEADWSGAVKPEPHRRFAINTDASKLYFDPGEINAYSLLHSQGMYEGQRKATDSKRVLNLTRSSYAGQHRYGTVTWNGDTCATWETLRRSIAEGLNFCATGEPYWTVDIGGFFIDNKLEQWFWRGDYSDGCRGLTSMDALEPDPEDQGCRDLGFHELYTRWLQYAVFLPIFRSHGTDAAREIWRFGEEGSPFYDAIAANIRLRYRLLPYIYSLAAAVTFEAAPMMQALALEYPEDRFTHNLTDQYLFGPSLMVCPVTQPMYYERNSRPLDGVAHSRKVYFPAGHQWYDARTGVIFEGGKTVDVNASLDSIPWFMRAGSILPMAPVMQYVDEIPDVPFELHVYTGADAEFTLYEDAGDGYDYEQGACARIHICWNEARGELKLAARKGSFPGMITEREFHVTFYAPQSRREYVFRYDGTEHRIRFIREGSHSER